MKALSRAPGGIPRIPALPDPPRNELQTAPEGHPEVIPQPGLRNRACVSQMLYQDLTSAALFSLTPNPGPVRSRTEGDCFDVWFHPSFIWPLMGALLKAS
jgi:hypothetical protein